MVLRALAMAKTNDFGKDMLQEINLASTTASRPFQKLSSSGLRPRLVYVEPGKRAQRDLPESSTSFDFCFVAYWRRPKQPTWRSRALRKLQKIDLTFFLYCFWTICAYGNIFTIRFRPYILNLDLFWTHKWFPRSLTETWIPAFESKFRE